MGNKSERDREEFDGSPKEKAKLKEIVQVIRPYKKRWTIGLILSLIGMAMGIQVPLIIQYLTKAILAGDRYKLGMGILWLLLMVIGNSIITWIRLRDCSFHIFVHTIRDLRHRVVDKILSHNYSFIDRHESGDLVATATNDAMALSDFLAHQTQMAITLSLQLIGTTVILYFISPTLLLIMLMFFPPMFILIFVYRKKIHPITYEQRTLFGKLSSRLQQNISAVQVVKAFTNTDFEIERFDKINKKYRDSSWKVGKLSSFVHPLIEFIWGFANLLIIGFAAYLILEDSSGFLGGDLSVDVVAAFIPALDAFMWPVLFLSWIGGEYGRVQAAFDRLKRIVDDPIDIIEKKDAIIVPELEGAIEFKGVNYGYVKEKPVIHNLNFTIEVGSTVAFLGPTGSGKSTIINLLMRFYDIISGKILLDGKYDVQDVDLDSYLTQVGIVAQEPFLYQKSFLENLTHGLCDYTMEDVIEACKIAKIHDFIESKEEKYGCIVGERGVTLSGGQKQRVTLARAILRKPKILILDAATSSVDVDTEYEIMMNLKKIFGKCTTIVITQRLSSVKNVDNIFVLANGEIVEEGSHSHLMKLNGKYADLYRTVSQSNREFMQELNSKTEQHEEEGR